MIRCWGLAADDLHSVIIVDAPPFLAAVLESLGELGSLPGVRVLLKALQDARSSRARVLRCKVCRYGGGQLRSVQELDPARLNSEMLLVLLVWCLTNLGQLLARIGLLVVVLLLVRPGRFLLRCGAAHGH